MNIAWWHKFRHPQDDISREAMTKRPATHGDVPPGRFPDQSPGGSPGADPEALLWTVLCRAPAPGISIPQLVTQTGMSRRWIYYRLEALAETGRAVQVARGLWRAVTTDGDGDE